MTRLLSDIDWESWQATDLATLVFVIELDRVLLILKKRGLGAGKINGPGGKCEDGEAPLDCAIRETQEELGITPTDLEYRGENRFQFADGYSIHVHVFVALGHIGTPIETDEAIPRWTALDAIPYAEMWEDDDLWLPHVLEGHVVQGWYTFDGDTMVDHRVEVTRRVDYD